MQLKMSSGKWRPSCLGPNVLIAYIVCSYCHNEVHNVMEWLLWIIELWGLECSVWFFAKRPHPSITHQPGNLFSVKDCFLMWDCYCRDKTGIRPSFHYNGNAFTIMTVSLYWSHLDMIPWSAILQWLLNTLTAIRILTTLYLTRLCDIHSIH